MRPNTEGMKEWGPVYDRRALVAILGVLPKGSTAVKAGNRWIIYVPADA